MGILLIRVSGASYLKQDNYLLNPNTGHQSSENMCTPEVSLSTEAPTMGAARKAPPRGAVRTAPTTRPPTGKAPVGGAVRSTDTHRRVPPAGRSPATGAASTTDTRHWCRQRDGHPPRVPPAVRSPASGVVRGVVPPTPRRVPSAREAPAGWGATSAAAAAGGWVQHP